jgi:hypothetical protein
MTEIIPVWISVEYKLKGPSYQRGMITVVKLGQENKEEMSVNTAL